MELEKYFQLAACTGIIARNPNDGTVYQARNFDNEMFINRIQYEGIFTRNGEEVFRAVQVVGFAGVFTGYKQGHFAIELNTRYPDSIGGNVEMLDNLLLRK